MEKTRKEKLTEKIKREKLIINKRYADYSEHEILSLILFEIRGINYTIKQIEKYLKGE